MNPVLLFVSQGKQSKVFKYAIRILWLVPGFLALGKTPPGDLDHFGYSLVWCIPNAIALLAPVRCVHEDLPGL